LSRTIQHKVLQIFLRARVMWCYLILLKRSMLCWNSAIKKLSFFLYMIEMEAHLRSFLTLTLSEGWCQPWASTVLNRRNKWRCPLSRKLDELRDSCGRYEVEKSLLILTGVKQIFRGCPFRKLT